MEQIPFPDGIFDLVLSNQVWQYATDRTATFREIRRVLKSGGTLAGGVWSGPEPGTVHSVEEEAIGRHLGAEFLPIHGWTFGGLEVLRSLAEHAGFTIRSLSQETHDARFGPDRSGLDLGYRLTSSSSSRGELRAGRAGVEGVSPRQLNSHFFRKTRRNHLTGFEAYARPSDLPC